MKKEIFMLKLGGVLITQKDKPFTERKETIERLADEIHEARMEKDFRLIVGNGGGSYPHPLAKKYRTSEGIVDKDSYKGIAEVQDAASRLNRIVVRVLLNRGENATTIQPSAICLAKNSRIIKLYSEPIKKYLEMNMVPVLYGDVGLDLAKGCCILSTEEIFGYLAKELKPRRAILAGIVDGVYTDDPLQNPDAKFISEITPENYQEVRRKLKGSGSPDVTGGMLLKVDRSMELVELGIESYIINGLVEGRVKDALLGEKITGTSIHK